jgi:hypothetical protein
MFLYRTANATAYKIVEARTPCANERQGSIDKTPELRAAEDRLEHQTLTRLCRYAGSEPGVSSLHISLFPKVMGSELRILL